VNLTGRPVVLKVTFHDAEGQLLGEATYGLGPYASIQRTRVLHEVAPGSITDASAEVASPDSEARFFAYASVIDNRSQDPSYIPGK
jgi:hypothetical protein